MGTHILDILRRSNIPVLMSKYMVQYEWQAELLMRTNDQIWKRPMLASDWSEPSGRGLEATIALKGLTEKIIVSHVIGARQVKMSILRASNALKARAHPDSRPIANGLTMPESKTSTIWQWDAL